MEESIKKQITDDIYKKNPEAKITVTEKIIPALTEKQLAKIARIQKKLQISRDEGSIPFESIKRDKPRKELIIKVEKTKITEDGFKLPLCDVYTFDDLGKEIKKLQRK